ncbi:MAG: ABC transporter substrate-binding protein [Chitinispirillales bacterium]|jgi:peptide/nickel transport system substrate-binding protein|nr:ABC transporter substrate-binding protein [Chitinispirillales bacterium]
MKKTLVLSAVILTAAIIFTCGNNSNNNGSGASGGAPPPPPDYNEIQKCAEAYAYTTGKPGGEIVLSTISDPKSFNPITSTETSTSEFTALMYEGLMTRNGVTLEMEPNIAERYETSADGLIWTFFIRPGVQWSDGAPLSAYDVEFTFNDLIYNMDIVPNSSRDTFSPEDKRFVVKALDSARVQFTLPFPFAPFLHSMGTEILPKHKLSGIVARKEFTTALSIKTQPKDMVVNGPFLLDSYLSSQKVVFKKNPRYWKKDDEGNSLPYLDRLVYMIVADQNAQLLTFLRGEIDYFSAKGEDFPELKRVEASSGGFSVFRLGPNSGASFLVFNQNLSVDTATKKTYVDTVKLSWFRNDNFRRAIAHAIDKENMIRIAMNGLGYPQVSPMTPGEGYFYTGDVPVYPYAPQKALEILEREGFKRDAGGDRFLRDKDGNIVEFSFVTNSGNNVRLKIAEIIRKDLQELGIKAHFQALEFNALIQKLDNKPFDWECILLGLTGGDEPHFGRNVWHSGGQLHMWYPRQKSPSTPWEARIDTIYNLAARELDRTKRKELYNEWQRVAADRQPFIYTVLSERIECVRDKFGNVNPTVNSSLLHNLERFYVK